MADKKLTKSQWQLLETAYDDFVGDVDDHNSAGGGHWILSTALNQCGINYSDRTDIAAFVLELIEGDIQKLESKKTVFTPDNITGVTFFIPNEQALCGEILGPFRASLTDNGVLFLESMNKPPKVGYMLLEDRLHRYEAAHVYVPYDPETNKKGRYSWVDYKPGCHPTAAKFGDIVPCDVEVEVYDLGDYSGEPVRRFAYKPPIEPEPQALPPAPEVPQPQGELEDGWVMI